MSLFANVSQFLEFCVFLELQTFQEAQSIPPIHQDTPAMRVSGCDIDPWDYSLCASFENVDDEPYKVIATLKQFTSE